MEIGERLSPGEGVYYVKTTYFSFNSAPIAPILSYLLIYNSVISFVFYCPPSFSNKSRF